MTSLIVENYQEFSKYYDLITNLNRRELLSLRIIDLLKTVPFSNNRILDIGCGTGNILLMLSKYSVDLIGLDHSPDMIAIAKRKILNKNNILLIESDMVSYSIHPPVSIAFCTSFSFTYLRSRSQILAALQASYNSLINGGMFLFDMLHPNTLNKYFTEQKTKIINNVEISTSLREYDLGEGSYTVEYIFSTNGVAIKEVHYGLSISIAEMTFLAKQAGYSSVTPSAREDNKIHNNYAYELLCIK